MFSPSSRAEIDPSSLRRHWRASLSIGLISFAAPFVGALLFSRYVLDWTWPASEIGDVALSTTSVAVVYAVMVESGLTGSTWASLCWQRASSPIWAPCLLLVACSPMSTGCWPSSSW
ncbi:MAG: cation:proton antiporter [Propionibacteriales bacterium]|nr:cation:proton antiporter [Propionibacteriales bacterium]